MTSNSTFTIEQSGTYQVTATINGVTQTDTLHLAPGDEIKVQTVLELQLQASLDALKAPRIGTPPWFTGWEQ